MEDFMTRKDKLVTACMYDGKCVGIWLNSEQDYYQNADTVLSFVTGLTKDKEYRHGKWYCTLNRDEKTVEVSMVG